MSYIAFIDMIGTRSSAVISNQEYKDAINDFNNYLQQVSTVYQCKIYGYSDNAYIQIENLTDTVKFFRVLRDTLMNKHRYFSAAIDCGSLQAEKVDLKDKGFSMKFTESDTVDIYRKQCEFTGIGISLSNQVVKDLQKKQKYDEFCESIFQRCPSTPEKPAECSTVFDISYEPVIFARLEYIIADYLMALATNARSGRYYLTPIISMIKCLDKEVVLKNLKGVISLLSLQSIPDSFKLLPHIKEHALYFVFALIEFILSLRKNNSLIDAKKICEQVIKESGIASYELVKSLPLTSSSVISNVSKRECLNILYNIK